MFQAKLTITSQDEEFLFAVHLVNFNVGIGRDDLLLGLEAIVLLELEISESSGQGEVS